MKKALPSNVYFAERLQRHQNRTGRTYEEISGDIDLKTSNQISNWKSGASKIPLDTVPKLSRAIPEVDLMELMFLRLKEELPETIAALEAAVLELLPSAAEQSLLDAVDDAAVEHRVAAPGPIQTDEERALVAQLVLQLAHLNNQYDAVATVTRVRAS